MGTVSKIVNDVASAITGNTEHATLDDFLNKYNDTTGKYVDTIDPLTTFDVYMKFYPSLGKESESKSSISKRILSVLTKDLESAIDELGNSVTGGLLGSLIGYRSIQNVHDSWTKNGQKSFLEMLTEANLLINGETWYSNTAIAPLEINIGPYVQDITIPNLVMADGGMQTTLLGEFMNNGQYVKPDNNKLIMNVVNSKASLHERLFYPWMKEVTLPYWSYATQPYTTATITIDFTKHADLKYVFCGCRPNQIFSMQANQDVTSGENIKRLVTFMFDFMFVHSDLNIIDDIRTKTNNTLGTIFNNVGAAINL